MRIETFEMERMQSTWENLVDYDMSESGVRPLTLRELTAMGFDLESFLDVPLGYSQSNGTIELRERIAALYPGATADHVEVTNGTSEANYIVALTEVRPGDVVAMQVPNYMQMWGVARSLGAEVRTFRLRTDAVVGARLGRVRARRHAEDAPALPVEPQQPDRLGALRRRDAAHRRSLPADGDVAAVRRGLPRRRSRAPARGRRASGAWATA